MDLSALRLEYSRADLDIDSVDPDPFRQFTTWFEQAGNAELMEPNAMVLATVDSDGRPSQRTVLLKYFDASGFVFFTNYGSRKAQQIGENANVSLLFQWLPLHRQVEIDGQAVKVSSTESLKYFLKRPRESQLGAWVSRQSEVVSSRSLLEAKLNEMKARFGNGEIPLPSFWGGFRIVPRRVEFWQGGPGRLHDRIEYLRQDDDAWQRQRLAP
ncbi:MAG: pyridoxamine 5'-phosphate oxidase [Pirellulaceae bacterium]